MVVMTPDQKIGSALKKRRMERGMSQPAIAKVMGISFQQVQKYENGKNRIAASRLYEFAKVLNTPVSHFYSALAKVTDEGSLAFAYRLSLDGSMDERFSRQTYEMMHCYNRLKTPRARSALLDMAKAVLEAERAEGTKDSGGKG